MDKLCICENYVENFALDRVFGISKLVGNSGSANIWIEFEAVHSELTTEDKEKSANC